MAVREIVLYGQSILRMKAKSVDLADDGIHELVEDMIETMLEAEGIGLAAPQVGLSKALCVVNVGLVEEGAAPKAFINPSILASSGNCTIEEGCLSIPDIREDVDRPELVTVRYQDLDNKAHEEEYDGMLARVLQHEIDHLNGVLFVDRISAIRRRLLAKRLKKIATQGGS